MSSLDKATILPIQPEAICHYAEIALPFLKLALEHVDQSISLESILTDIANHKRQLWIIKHDGQYIAAVVTMIYTTNAGIKKGDISLAGGSLHEKWDHFVDVVGAWLKAQGCQKICFFGRKGWQRQYEARGFQVKYVHLEKDL